MNTHYLKKTIVAMAACLVLLTGAANAGATETWMHHDIVEADVVISHVTVPMADTVMIIDSRPYKPMYVKGHIPGAVSIPDTVFDKNTDLLPKDCGTCGRQNCGKQNPGGGLASPETHV